MRIISGTYRGKLIHPPSGFRARPTTDFAKESLFNIIRNHFDIDELAVLDLFSGTGSISYEFASRGAERITAVENDTKHFRFIRKMTEELDFVRMQVIQADAFRFIRKPVESYDIIFADPPFDLDKLASLPDLVFATNILISGGWFILEHPAKEDFRDHPRFREHRKYGSVNFSVFS